MEVSFQTNTVDSVLTENTVDSDRVFDDTYPACSAPHVSKEEDCNFVYQDEDQEVTYMVPVPKGGTPKELSLTPITIMTIDTIGMKKSRNILKVLLRSGQYQNC